MWKAAFAYWDNRIAPVFDSAKQVRLVEVDSNGITAETPEVLPDEHLVPESPLLG